MLQKVPDSVQNYKENVTELRVQIYQTLGDWEEVSKISEKADLEDGVRYLESMYNSENIHKSMVYQNN